MISVIGFLLWYLHKISLVDLGGSMSQAQLVYGYIKEYIESDEMFMKPLRKEPKMKETIDEDGNYVKCLPASQKQVRGPHPDALFIDEACETKDEIINAALPMNNTSDNPITVITSTFHKIFGIFQEIWDDAEQRGYERYSWDVFDVAKSFDPEIWEDERLNKEIPDLHKLRELADGRTGHEEGWIPIENIIEAFRSKGDMDYFLVEYMGTRPATSGLVTDPEDVEACQIETVKYGQGECIMGIDWGFSSMTSIVDFEKRSDDDLAMIHNENYSQVRADVIIEDVIEEVKKRPNRKKIYADSAGKFENKQLQNELHKAYKNNKIPNRVKVVEVVFSKEKSELLGAYRSYWNKRKFLIPNKFKTAIWQYKRYRYKEGSDKPMKKDDHIPDATLCALRPFKPKGKSGGLNKKVYDRDDQKSITSGLRNKTF